MRSQEHDDGRGTRTIGGRVNGDGTLAGGTGFNVTRTGTGSYIVRFPSLKVISSAVALLQGVYAGYISTSVGPNEIGVTTWSAAVAASDVPFSFTVTGLPR